MLADVIDFRYAVEYDAAIAAVGAQLGGHTFVSRVQDVDYSTWGALDYLHASPVCKEFSQAKTGGAEGDEEITSAQAVVRCLEATQPRVVTIENVQGYVHSRSYRLICQALDRGGYMWHAEVVNSADYGVPQTRRRLIVRAVRDALLAPLPPPVRWRGWYEAIEDLIPGLPESRFAPWQLERLPANIKGHTFFNQNESDDGRGGTYGVTARNYDQPATTIKASVGASWYKSFIVDGQTNDGGALLTVPHREQPMYTVSASSERRPARAWLVSPAGNNFENDTPLTIRPEGEPSFPITSAHGAVKYRAWLHSGRVVKMTPRALARFMSCPDWYVLPDRAALACTIVGNAVPSLLMREIVTPLM
jgi:site-specific DNA-cytosine methylase